ncbi:MAG: metal ABC transporter permease [Alphaproteobacteria bacterium]|nr:metal ABC transporter permease [Alphaproteobacteria bacterium]
MSFDFGIFTILAPAFVAGAIISLAHVPLGAEVLKRGIIFLDLAVAQFAALGMIAFRVFFESHDMDPRYAAAGSLAFGLSLALACALGLHMLEKRAGRYQEALIGSAFVLAASFSILLMAGDPHSGEQMADIMAGQVLWITWHDLMIYSPVFVLGAGLWRYLKKHRAHLFYILFALTIPFSVNLIGVYLVFASLILPALGALAWPERRKLAAAYMISITAIGSGLILSILTDTPTGPAMVCMYPLMALASHILAKQMCFGKSRN